MQQRMGNRQYDSSYLHDSFVAMLAGRFDGSVVICIRAYPFVLQQQLDTRDMPFPTSQHQCTVVVSTGVDPRVCQEQRKTLDVVVLCGPDDQGVVSE
jgi:hypothetical protein